MKDFPAGRRNFLLHEIGEPDDNVLRLVVAEARPKGRAISIGNTGLKGRRVVARQDVGPLELTWESYVTYSVRNESFARSDANGVAPKKMLRELPDSAFLAYVAQATIATHDYPGKLRHWQLVCLNHVLDVVSTVEPTIRKLVTPLQRSTPQVDPVKADPLAIVGSLKHLRGRAASVAEMNDAISREAEARHRKKRT